MLLIYPKSAILFKIGTAKEKTVGIIYGTITFFLSRPLEDIRDMRHKKEDLVY
jgi:hypothetical protein